jgi:hypothetical protein
VLAPPAPWSGTRTGLKEQNVTPQRPAHRTPERYERPEFGAAASKPTS